MGAHAMTTRVGALRMTTRVAEAIADALDDNPDDDKDLTKQMLAVASEGSIAIRRRNAEKAREQQAARGSAPNLLGVRLAPFADAVTDAVKLPFGEASHPPPPKKEETTVEVNAANNSIADVATKAVKNINPFAKYLLPAQQALGGALQPVRIVRRVLSWEDVRLTLVVDLALFAVAIACGLVLQLLPWGLIMPWLMRVVGLALTGPHMLYVGRWLENKAAENKAEQQEYEVASKARREEILGTHRDRMIRDEGLKLRKKLAVLAKRSETERARAEFYSRNRLKIQRMAPLVIGEKSIVAPDPDRSTATAPPPSPTEAQVKIHWGAAKVPFALMRSKHSAVASKPSAVDLV